MNSFKRLFGLINKSKNAEDIKEVTDFLKKNDTFKKIALDIHKKQQNVKSSFFSTIDDLLEQEDGLKKENKQITDDSKNKKK